MPPLINSKGVNINAIIGVLNALNKLIVELDPKFFVMVFDAKGKNFRHEISSEYKAHRPPMDDELRQQIEPLHKIIKLLGIPLLIVDEVEADDVIATLAKQAEAKNYKTIISSRDKDLAQLVSDKVNMYDVIKNQLIDTTEVIDKYGVHPTQMLDYLSLIGDTSDNIQGVPKCGKVTATKWLTEYKTLDNLLENADKIKGKIGENLRANLDTLDKAKKLIALKFDCKIPIALEDFVLTKPNLAETKEIFIEYELNAWLRRLEQQLELFAKFKDNTNSITPVPPTQQIAPANKIQTPEELQKLLQDLKNITLVFFDINFDAQNINDKTNKLIAIHQVALKIITNDSDICIFFEPNEDTQINFLTKLSLLFEANNIQKIGFNLKPLFHLLINYEIISPENFDAFDDLSLRYYLMDSNINSLNLTSLHNRFLADKIHDEKFLIFAKNRIYSIELLFEYLKTQQNDLQDKLYYEVEKPLTKILLDIEKSGTLIDKKLLEKYSLILKDKINQIEQEVYILAGEEFNLASASQLKKILFEKLQYPISIKTPSGAASTNEEALFILAKEYPIASLMLEHRTLSKIKSTYVEGLLKRLSSHNKVHTHYQQASTLTGRISSTDPNLQSIPSKNPNGRKIREAFICEAGAKIAAFDYSQIELRIMAHLSEDPGLITAFKNNIDIHKATAAEIFAVNLDQVSDNHRRLAKAVNFGLIYGMSEFGLHRQLDISIKEAKEYIKIYFQRFPKIADYMQLTKDFAHSHGYVETILKRRLLLPNLRAKNFQLRAHAERAAINGPMQGSAAEIIKLAMLQVYQTTQDFQAQLLMQVHDELVLSIKNQNLNQAVEAIKQIMESAVQLKVPLIVNYATGDNWDEAH